jgi:hypothetical protein
MVGARSRVKVGATTAARAGGEQAKLQLPARGDNGYDFASISAAIP